MLQDLRCVGAWFFVSLGVRVQKAGRELNQKECGEALEYEEVGEVSGVG